MLRVLFLRVTEDTATEDIMKELWKKLLEKLPNWLLAAALLIFVLLMLIPMFKPDRQVQFYGKTFGLVGAPAWEVTREIENPSPPDGQPIDLNMPASDGFCFLTYVSGPMPGKSENVLVFSDGKRWYLKNTALPNEPFISRAACVRFATKWNAPVQTLLR